MHAAARDANDAAAMEKQGRGSSGTILIQLLCHLASLLLDVFQNNANQDHDQISTLTLLFTLALPNSQDLQTTLMATYRQRRGICIYVSQSQKDSYY